MGSLAASLFELFAFRSKRVLFIAVIAVSGMSFLAPPAMSFFFATARIERQAELVIKLNGVDKTKIKDKRLADSYETIVDSVKATQQSALRFQEIADPPKSFGDIFAGPRLPAFIAGAFLWAVLAVVALLTERAKPLERIIVAFHALVLGFLAGWLCQFLPATEPRYALYIAIPLAETLAFTVIGTLVADINGRGA